MLGSLRGGMDHDGATLITRDCARHEEKFVLGVHCVNGQVLDGYASTAHASRHLLAAEDATRVAAAPMEPGFAVVAVRTVRCVSACEAVTFHGAGEAFYP